MSERRAGRAIGWALLLTTLAGSGCGRDEPATVAPGPVPVTAVAPAPPAPKRVALAISPATAELRAADPGLQLVLTRDYAALGTVADLSAAAKWTTEPAGIVAVEPSGYVRALKPGRAVVRGEVADAASGRELAGESAITVAGPAAAGRTWNFAEEIEPRLTLLGCNTGGCHGRLDGQNGLHLSLFGYDAEGDHEALTRGAFGRRVDRFRPESSLLLTKATGTVPHGGGMKLVLGSDHYQTIRDWIAAGAPLLTPGDPGRITRLVVDPGDSRLEEPGPRQLRVVAHYEGGTTRDVTRLSQFRTLDDATVAVDARGSARLLKRGEADVVVRYESQVVTARLGSALNPGVAHDFGRDARTNFIDDEVHKRLARLNVPPSPPASDAAFLRRASLDLTGEQPGPDRVRRFLADTDPAKRFKLVADLVASPDFVRFWQIKLGDLLEITSARPDLGNSAISYGVWLRKQLAANAPWDQTVRTLLTSTGDPADRETGGPVAYSLEAADPRVAAEKAAQRFLGLRLRCAQCHDHPFDLWTQDDYFGLAAAFSRVDRSSPGMMGMMANRTVIRINPEGKIDNPRTRKPAVAKILGGATIAAPGDADPRVALADWMTAADNPFFARAMANWVWSQFFGAGIVNPPDDLSRANPPVHPALLDALAKHFVDHRYDLRDLVTTIATSSTYAAGSATVPGNEADDRLFSHQRPRPLTAHQMADALAQATDVVNRYRDKSSGTRAIEITDPTTPSMILEAFGRCNRINGCSSVATPALSLRQSLMLIGGDVIEGKVLHPRGYLANLLELHPDADEVVENLYLRSLCRPPTAEELAHWTKQLRDAPSLREAAEDLFWALLNSREFAFNH